jgi:transposase
MAKTTRDLPDDVDALKALVASKDQRIAALEEKLRLALHKRFAASSEKASPDQINLFDEAEQTQSEATTTPPDADVDSMAVSTGGSQVEPTKKTRGRKPLPEHLPRRRIEHDIPEADKRCACGCQKTRIGEETSEQLSIIPAQIEVLQHVRFKYACRSCEGVNDDGPTIVTAPMSPQPIPKSNASPELLAYISVAKFVDGMPLYRLEPRFKRIGVELPRNTMAGWMIRCGALIVPLINLMQDSLLDYDIIQMDETSCQVLKENGRAAQSKSYMWVRRGGPPDKPVILFDYDQSRSGSVPARLLGEWPRNGARGTLQTDGYEGYAAVARRDGIIHVGCLAHARRKFDEALKAQSKKGRGGLAKQGLELIQRIYAQERDARIRQLEPQMRKQLRDEKAKPIWNELRIWLDGARGQVPPQTLTGKALGYLDKQWPRLFAYLNDGRIEVDNNLTENAIRPFVIGRKAWLFADTPAGADASARLYSLIETAKANGVEPYAYLRHVFKMLPAAQTVEDIEALLPWNTALGDAVSVAAIV